MLIGGIARFFISFLVSNWIYSEIVLLCPSFDRYAKDLYQAAKIPTHDKWGALADSNAADKLGLDIERQISTASPSAGRSFAHIFDQQIRDLWSGKTIKPLMDFFGDTSLAALPSQRKSFLSGDEIFARRTLAAIEHARF